MNSKLFIAEKVKVGFNPREDTYTGKLGYVIGFDGKKWRKEPSWEGWRYQYVDGPEFEVKKLENYNNTISQYTSSYHREVEYYNSAKNENNRSYYAKTANQTLEEFLSERIKPYNEFKPSLGRLSCDEGMKVLEFDNVPTEGFVLNKKAGGYSNGWNHRSTYCRVYDPRGFEFEISIPNLLFILQESNSMKGKGLEGSFVYAWDGKDLVLLPTSSEDYVKSGVFTKLQSGKVSAKELIPGLTYKNKQMEDYVYVGRFNWVQDDYFRNYETPCVNVRKMHVFYNLSTDAYHEFIGLANSSSFVQVVTDTPISNYAEILEKFNDSKFSGSIINTTLTDYEIPKTVRSYYDNDNLYVGQCILPLDNNQYELYDVSVSIGGSYGSNYPKPKSYSIISNSIVKITESGDVSIKKTAKKEHVKMNFSSFEALSPKLLNIQKNKELKAIKF